MKNKIKFINSIGQELVCDVVAMFKNENANYVAYTDNAKTDNGKLDLLVSKYVEVEGKLQLISITDEKEYQFAEEYLERELFEEGETLYD